MVVTLLLALGAPPRRVDGQWRLHAQAIPHVTTAWHTPGDETRTEFVVTQPALMVNWSTPRLASRSWHLFLRATLNGEGVTIPDGELTPGAHGEGYYDRRHPHTYVHELIAGGSVCAPSADGCRLQFGLAAGKGFVAFGTDDPMSRPVERYPVNHHLAQILERGVILGGMRYRWLVVEHSRFNGDEPTRPKDQPNWDRGLDSYAWRISTVPWGGVEAQYSYAEVRSPEHRPGAGPTQKKRSASVRYQGPLVRRNVYGLLEWARTEEANGFFEYRSLLLEGAADLGPHRPYFRLESTERPEEQRTLDPFRSLRPHLDNSIIGRTRWRIATLGYGVSYRTAQGRLEVRPFVEGSLAQVRALEGIFNPDIAYGSDVLPSLTMGVRMDWGGMSGMRMGRYFDAVTHSEHSGHQ
jgi:hypothetical protein